MTRSHKTLLIALFSGLSLGLPAHRAFAAVDNVEVVDPGRLVRGARAESYEDFKAMVLKYNIGRIVNVENEQSTVDRERGWIERLHKETGRRVFQDRKPVGHYDLQSKQYIEDIENSMRDNKSGAVWLHCKRGRDRTGFLTSIYRVWHQNWNPEDAHDEWHSPRFSGGVPFELRFPKLEDHFSYTTQYAKTRPRWGR